MSSPCPAETQEPTDPVAEVLAVYDGDATAAILGLLHDIEYLRRQIDYAALAVSPGYTRGWRPTYERQADDER